MKSILRKLGVIDMPSFWAFMKQFLKFGIVGLTNTLLSLAIYYVLVYFGVNYLLSNLIAFVISVLNAYYWNSRYVFRESKTGRLRALVRVYASYGITFLLSTGLLYCMVDVLSISEYIAPVLNLIVTVPVNFLMNKFWAFR